MDKISDSDKTSRQGVHLCGMLFIDNDWTYNEQTTSDFGIDVHTETKIEGRPTGRLLALQIKTGRSWFRETYSDGWIYRPSEEHKVYWLNYSLPVVLILVDYENKVGYWVAVTNDSVISTGKNYKVQIPSGQQLDAKGFTKLRELATAEIPRKQKELWPGPDKEVFENDDFQWLPSYTPKGVEHKLYPKEGSKASPSLEVEFVAGQDNAIREFLEKGIGGEFEAIIRKSNFLPKSLIGKDVIKMVTSDLQLAGVFPVLFCWHGDDGYRFQQEFTLKSKRAGNKELIFESIIGPRDRLQIAIDLKRRQGDINYFFQIAGGFTKRAVEVLEFTASTMAGGTLSIIVQNSGDQLLSNSWRREKDFEMINALFIVKKYLQLEEYLGKPLKIPQEWFEQSDIWAILEACDILTDGKIYLGNCKLNIPVGYDLSEKLKRKIDGSGNISLTADRSKRTIAGYEFDFGPCRTVVSDPMIVEEEVNNHVIEADGMIAYPEVINVPVRSKSGSVVQYFENFLASGDPS